MPEPAPTDPLDTPEIRRIAARKYLPAPLAERWHVDADAETRQAVLMSLNRLLSLLTTYLPRHLLYHLFKRPTPGQAYGEFLSSTVLFADLSGFTVMSERLSALGREGAETLTAVINHYFTVMSDIATHHGGDVMLFGGDAMLLLFDGVDHALRACHTAWRMQQAMAARFAEVKTELGAFPLRMAAGLGSGPTFAAALGSTNGMQYAVMGPALTAMGRAEALAGAGRIILDQATRLLAGPLTVEAESESGYARLIAEPVAPYTRPDPPQLDLPPSGEHEQVDWLAERVTAIAPFLAPGLLPRLVLDPSVALEGEHRPVTVVFVDFRDADALIDRLGADDPNAITPRLNVAFDAVRSIVARYEGVINKIGAGPAGSHIIALFGAPTSHEDDPERGVQAALDIQTALAGAELPGAYPTRIGVNTGFVYAANVGSRARREYTVMGDQVNLAARLMTAAQPGQVIVSALTAAHVRHLFDLEERKPVQLKGKAQAQSNCRVRRARSRSRMLRPAVSSQLLGRAEEIQIGYERIQAVWLGRSQIIAVSGEAGVGKSRLIEALAQYARAEGFDVISSACVSYGGGIPYSVWLESLQALIGWQPSDTEADRRARLRDALAAIDRVEDAPIVGEVLGVSWPDTTWTASLEAQARQRRLFDVVASLIRHFARRRSLLWMIDDAHWIDPASLEMLNHLARYGEGAPIVLLVASRSEGKWRGWEGLSNAVEITLPLLDRAATEALVADLLRIEDRQLPLAVRTLMKRMAAGVLDAGAPDTAAFERYWGNPFFALERVRALIEAGDLARDAAGHWRVTRPIESIEMPDTIHGVIMSRIDRLPEPARRVLQVASVIGRTIGLPLLQAVYDLRGETAESLQRHLQTLSDLGLSPLDTDPDQGRYAFRSVTTQEVAYASLRYERRRELHRRIGEQIEAHPTWVDDAPSLLTHHYSEGQVWDKALSYALEAGRRAQQKYANAAAAGAYRRALQAAEALTPPRVGEQLAAHEALGDVLLITGDYDEALKHYDAARTLAIGDSRHLADLCRKTADALQQWSKYDEAHNWLKQGLDYADPDSLEAAQIHLVGAAVFHRQGKLDQAVEWGEKCLGLAIALTGDTARRTEARALYLLAEILRKRGNLDRSIEAAQRAVTVYQLVGDIWGQSQALNTLANISSEKGDFVTATRFYADSLELKERIGDVGGQANITINLGEAYRVLGRLAEARQTFEHSLRICRDLRNEHAVALLHNNLAAIALAEGNWDEAARCLLESNRLFDAIGSEEFKAELHRHQAELDLGRGQIAEAFDYARQAVAVAEASQEKLEIGLSRCVLGQVYLAQDDLIGAERELQASLDILESVGSPVEAANTRLALAQLRRRQDRPEEARQLIGAAIQTYESVAAEPLKMRALNF